MNKKYTWKSYSEEIESYGFKISFARFAFTLLGFMAIVLTASFLYFLQIPYIIGILVFFLVITPSILKTNYKRMYEEKRFEDICTYMEQMCASFHKHSKIITSLQDAALVLDGKLKNYVLEAIEYIDNGLTSNPNKNIYEEAFNIIEDKYRCKRLIELHKFLIKIESDGAKEYKTALNILQEDIHYWMERVYLFQKERNNIKKSFTGGIIFSLIICYINLLYKKYVNITVEPMYQIFTTVFIIAILFSYLIISKTLAGSWLEQISLDRIIMKNYKIATTYSASKARKRILPILIILAVSIVPFYIFKNYITCGVLAIVFLYLAYHPSKKIKRAWKRTLNEIEKSFPEWLRDVAINIQFQSVQMSIYSSYENAPIVLKPELEKLINGLNDNPTSIEPYNQFLKSFNLSEVNSALKMLYSITELGNDDIEESLNALMKRNYVLIDDAEKRENKSNIDILKDLVKIPGTIVSVKIIIDAIIALTIYTTNIYSYVDMFK